MLLWGAQQRQWPHWQHLHACPQGRLLPRQQPPGPVHFTLPAGPAQRRRHTGAACPHVFAARPEMGPASTHPARVENVGNFSQNHNQGAVPPVPPLPQHHLRRLQAKLVRHRCGRDGGRAGNGGGHGRQRALNARRAGRRSVGRERALQAPLQTPQPSLAYRSLRP